MRANSSAFYRCEDEATFFFACWHAVCRPGIDHRQPPNRPRQKQQRQPTTKAHNNGGTLWLRNDGGKTCWRAPRVTTRIGLTSRSSSCSGCCCCHAEVRGENNTTTKNAPPTTSYCVRCLGQSALRNDRNISQTRPRHHGAPCPCLR